MRQLCLQEIQFDANASDLNLKGNTFWEQYIIWSWLMERKYYVISI